MSVGIQRIVLVCHVMKTLFNSPYSMKKPIIVLALCSFIFVLDAVPEAPKWCADKTFEFSTNYRSDSHRRAARLAKGELCRVVKEYGLLYGPWEWEAIPKAGAYSPTNAALKLCSGTGSLNSNKDIRSREAATKARNLLCKAQKQPSPVLKPTVQKAPCYMVRGVCVIRPAVRAR